MPAFACALLLGLTIKLQVYKLLDSLFSRQQEEKDGLRRKNPIGNKILCCVGVKLTHSHLQLLCCMPLSLLLRIFTSSSCASVQLGPSAVYDLFKTYSWSFFRKTKRHTKKWKLRDCPVVVAHTNISRRRPARFHTWEVATWNKLTVPHRIRKPPVWLLEQNYDDQEPSLKR